MAPTGSLLTAWFEAHRGFLWGLCYRITGSAADADDLVQETFIRALQRGPDRLDEPRVWLTRVAVNAARDSLRRRRRRGYIGPWLPTPVDSGDGRIPGVPEPAADEGRTQEARYGILESASLAFLHALEALTPTQRAVLILRDVFDYSAAEAGRALDLSAGNVRTIHHRAARAMVAYDRRRAVSTPATRARTQKALERFLELLGAGDVDAIEGMLAADVRAVADGGGEFTAILRPVSGPFRVARLFARLRASRHERARVEIRSMNGFPAAVVEFRIADGRRPPRLLVALDTDPTGLVSTIRVIVNSRKLRALGAALPQPSSVRSTSTSRGDAPGPKRFVEPPSASSF